MAPPPKALVAIADGSEEIETVTIADVLVRAGVAVELAAVGEGKCITGSRGIKIGADKSITECSGTSYDLIVLPGGKAGAEKLRDCAPLIQLLEDQRYARKLYGGICAAPAVALAPHGLLDGHKATCYPTLTLPAAYASPGNPTVVVSDNLITSRGPGTAMAFALKLVEALQGTEEARTVAEALLYNQEMYMEI